VSNFDPEFTETDVESVRANNLVGSTSYGTFENFTYDESEMNKAETGN